MPVRPATPDDLAAIAEIYAHYVTTSVATFELEAPDLDEWTRRHAAIADARLPFVVIERDDRVAGYAYCAPWKTRPAYKTTTEDSVYVAPWAVGTGCGAELLAALLEMARAVGVREVIAVIAADVRSESGSADVRSESGSAGVRSESGSASGDDASIRLHEKFGFRDAGRLTAVGYKHDRWLDTVLMQWSAAPASPD